MMVSADGMAETAPPTKPLNGVVNGTVNNNGAGHTSHISAAVAKVLQGFDWRQVPVASK